MRRRIPYDSDYDERDDSPEYWCTACGKPCWARWVDEGYGQTEYWGSVSTHTDWQAYSDCCEASVTDEEPPIEGEEE